MAPTLERKKRKELEPTSIRRFGGIHLMGRSNITAAIGCRPVALL